MCAIFAMEVECIMGSYSNVKRKKMKINQDDPNSSRRNEPVGLLTMKNVAYRGHRNKNICSPNFVLTHREKGISKIIK